MNTNQEKQIKLIKEQIDNNLKLINSFDPESNSHKDYANLAESLGRFINMLGFESYKGYFEELKYYKELNERFNKEISFVHEICNENLTLNKFKEYRDWTLTYERLFRMQSYMADLIKRCENRRSIIFEHNDSKSEAE